MASDFWKYRHGKAKILLGAVFNRPKKLRLTFGLGRLLLENHEPFSVAFGGSGEVYKGASGSSLEGR